MYFIRSTEEEKKALNEVLEGVTVNSKMSLLDKEFLNSFLLRLKPKKILEVGVCAGASSVMILNAIKNNPDACLHSIDISKQWQQNKAYETGFLVNRYFPHLLDKWKMYSGDYAFAFMEEIGAGIDFCLIDTNRATPGVILDFLMVLPFLKEHAIVMLQGIAPGATCGRNGGCASLVLMSAISGMKFLPQNEPNKNFYRNFQNEHPEINNIGAVALEGDMGERLFDLFCLLLMPWQYGIKKEDAERIGTALEKYYPEEYVDLYYKAVSCNPDMIV